MEPPIIRIEMEHMKHTLIHAMAAHFTEQDERVKNAITQAIDNYDYAGEVAKLVGREITDAIVTALREYLQVGGDGYKNIQELAIHRIDAEIKDNLDGDKPAP